MTTPAYTISDKTITIMVAGLPRQIPRDSHVSAELVRILNDWDDSKLDRLIDLMDPVKRVSNALNGSGVEINGNTVSVNGKRIVKHLEDRILDLASSGFDVLPWKKFVAKLADNPSRASRDELALFLEDAGLPITEDGCFLAYKRVRADYSDCRTGTFDNSVGQVVEMPRHEVDDDRRNLCSTGLHFCSKGYLASFYGEKIVIVKVDPADVVSIPADHNNQKGRTWRYEVVGEIDPLDNGERHSWGLPVYNSAPTFDSLTGTSGWGRVDEDIDDYEDDDEDDDEEDYDESTDFWSDEDDDDYDETPEQVEDDEIVWSFPEEFVTDEVAVPEAEPERAATAFKAPGVERKSFWSKFLG